MSMQKMFYDEFSVQMRIPDRLDYLSGLAPDCLNSGSGTFFLN
jgi:hypothetical protein